MLKNYNALPSWYRDHECSVAQAVNITRSQTNNHSHSETQRHTVGYGTNPHMHKQPSFEHTQTHKHLVYTKASTNVRMHTYMHTNTHAYTPRKY